MDDKEKRQLEFAIEKMKSGRPDETIGILEPLAEKGDATALFWLGFRHLHTMRVPDNDPKTKRRFQWVRRDEKKVLELIGMSAEKDYPPALFWMAKAYHDGRRVRKDDEKAFLFFQKAAEKGHIPSIYMLSECHRKAWGTPVNIDEAIRLCKQVAEAGYPPAEYRMVHYCGGDAMTQEQSDSESMEKEKQKRIMYWMRKAAEHGHMVAQYMLGRYYLEEKNNREQAVMWLSKSTKHLTNAQRLLEKINKEEAKS